MKKYWNLLLILVIGLVLFGCDDITQNPTASTTKPKDDNTTTLSITEKDYDNCTLTYASWDLGLVDSEKPNMERYMLDEFEKAYPGIAVNVIERPKVPGTENDQNWDEFLAAKASVGTLPDVFMPDLIPLCVENAWALDVTNYVKDDVEYNKMSSDVKAAATYDGHVMALPQSIFHMGFLVNKSLYDKANSDAPTVETSLEDLLSETKAAANHSSKTGAGVVGLKGIEHILHWLPAQLNPDLQWWTYDGTKFNLDGVEFTEAVNQYRTLRADSTYVLEALQDKASEEDSTIVLEDIFGTTDYINSEKILCNFIYSYSFGEYQTKINNEDLKSEYAFIGTPVVDGVKKVPIVLDFLCVSSQSEHPYEAYLLAKWMGFGDAGYTKRLELSETYSKDGMSIIDYPSLTNNEEHLDKYFELYSSFEDLRSIIEAGNYIVEPVKFLPGYNEARYTGTYDPDYNMFQEIVKIMTGEVNIADVKVELNTRANALLKAASDAMYGQLNG